MASSSRPFQPVKERKSPWPMVPGKCGVCGRRARYAWVGTCVYTSNAPGRSVDNILAPWCGWVAGTRAVKVEGVSDGAGDRGLARSIHPRQLQHPKQSKAHTSPLDR